MPIIRTCITNPFCSSALQVNKLFTTNPDDQTPNLTFLISFCRLTLLFFFYRSRHSQTEKIQTQYPQGYVSPSVLFLMPTVFWCLDIQCHWIISNGQNVFLQAYFQTVFIITRCDPVGNFLNFLWRIPHCNS